MPPHRKQEQEPATDEVTEVGPGVVRFQLPIQMPGLGHVNTYALLDERGAAIVDPGMPGPLTWREDGDTIKLAGREWTPLHTPGPTLDHRCLHDPEEGLLLSGDHVLPTITPHIAGIGTGPDPLSSYLSSLRRVERLGNVRRVLPAHGHPFDDLAGRVKAIERHHA